MDDPGGKQIPIDDGGHRDWVGGRKNGGQRKGNRQRNDGQEPVERVAEEQDGQKDQPESQAESARKMGLGYAAGITFFATIAFMLLIGWGADLVLGSKPWGLVGGIVLGAVIAFIQFFRITNRIYNTPKDAPSVRPLMSDRDDDARL